MPVKHILALCTLAVLSACSSDATAPSAPVTTARYVLVAADDQPVPALVLDETWDGERVQVYAMADTIFIGSDGRYVQRALIHVYSDDRYVGRSRRSDRGVVTRTGTQLRFESDYFQNLTFDATLADGALTVVQDLSGDGVQATMILRER